MEKTKAIFSKIVQYIGMFGAIFVVLLTFSGKAAMSAELSVLLGGITAVCIYAIFNLAFAKNKSFKRFTEGKSSGLMFFMGVTVLVGLFIRSIALMLLDIDILGKRALIYYIYSILFYVLIYLIGRLCWSHKAGVASAVIYVLWCAFDLYPVVAYMGSGKDILSLLKYCVGNVAVYSVMVLVLYALRCNSLRKGGIALVAAGSISIFTALITENALPAIVCIVLFLLISRSTLKYDGRFGTVKSLIPSIKYVFYFGTGAIASAFVIALAVFCFDIGRLLPSWTLYVHDYASVKDFILTTEKSVSDMWSGIYFERNNFISYVMLIMYLFIGIASACGCRNSTKLSNSNASLVIIFPLVLTLFGLAENANSPMYIWMAMPCMIILAGGGVSEIFMHVSMPYGGYNDTNRTVFKELPLAKREEIKNRYALPEKWEKLQITGINGSDTSEEAHASSERPASERVASGDELDGMLDNLFGNNPRKNPDEISNTDTFDDISDTSAE